MKLEHSLAIDAPAARVWDILADVARWPEWTASIDRVERLDGGELGLGCRVRIKQPRFPAVVWQVTEWDADSAFVWESKSPGARTVASHRIVTNPGGGVTVRLALDQTGPLFTLLGWLTSGISRRYLGLEAEGLKRRAELA
jgi:uncharacterized membrane protein